jgi:CDGSH iron-sulfur domain-containing protein 3
MPDIKIRIRDNGPLVVEAPFTLCDAEGKEFPLDPAKPTIALCRCGHSARKPFCDGAHKEKGFMSADRAPTPVNPS